MPDTPPGGAPPAPEPAASPAPPPASRPRMAPMSRRDLATVAGFALGTMAFVALVLRFAFGAAGHAPRGAALAPVGTPPAGQCAVRRDDGRVAGQVVGLMGREGRLSAYRLEEWPGHGVAPLASTLDVPAGEVHLVPCASLGAAPAR